jgi:hypothetical protein
MTLHEAFRKLENGLRQDIVLPPSKTGLLSPINALVSLGSFATKATGRVSFGLTIEAPENRSQLARALVEVIGGRPAKPWRFRLVNPAVEDDYDDLHLTWDSPTDKENR